MVEYIQNNDSTIRFIVKNEMIYDFYFFNLITTSLDVTANILIFNFSDQSVIVRGKNLKNILFEYMDKRAGFSISDQDNLDGSKLKDSDSYIAIDSISFKSNEGQDQNN